MKYKLIEPHTAGADWRSAFLDMAREWERFGEMEYAEELAAAERDFDGYLQHLADMKSGVGLKEGYVPQTVFWLVDSEGTLVGVSRLRHRLSSQLEDEGGHIGYDIRPSCRGQGFGALILAKTLEAASQRGLRRVLLTCNHDNVASRRIIEKNGGRLVSESRSRTSGSVQARYWIDFTPEDASPDGGGRT
jgi:predicted acetyltransferase